MIGLKNDPYVSYPIIRGIKPAVFLCIGEPQPRNWTEATSPVFKTLLKGLQRLYIMYSFVGLSTRYRRLLLVIAVLFTIAEAQCKSILFSIFSPPKYKVSKEVVFFFCILDSISCMMVKSTSLLVCLETKKLWAQTKQNVYEIFLSCVFHKVFLKFYCMLLRITYNLNDVLSQSTFEMLCMPASLPHTP